MPQLWYDVGVGRDPGTHLDRQTMNIEEFQAQCLRLLAAARKWPDHEWEQLEGTWTMGILDAMGDLEYDLER